jgi:serine/threonine protein kinase
MILRELHHDNLPKVYDHFSEADSYFLVMDYIEGDDLLALPSKRDQRHFPAEQIKMWSKTLLETVKWTCQKFCVNGITTIDLKKRSVPLTVNDSHREWQTAGGQLSNF